VKTRRALLSLCRLVITVPTTRVSSLLFNTHTEQRASGAERKSMNKLCAGLTLTIVAVISVVLLGPFSTKKYEEGSTTKSSFYFEGCSNDISRCHVFISGFRQAVKHTAYSVAHAISVADVAKMPRDTWERFVDTVQQASLGCVPDQTTNGAMVAIWMDYLRKHPDKHDELAPITLSAAVMEAYPCS